MNIKIKDITKNGKTGLSIDGIGSPGEVKSAVTALAYTLMSSYTASGAPKEIARALTTTGLIQAVMAGLIDEDPDNGGVVLSLGRGK